MSETQFLLEWARYIKWGQVRKLEVVLQRTPSNRHQLSFMLEVVMQLVILRKDCPANLKLLFKDVIESHQLAGSTRLQISSKLLNTSVIQMLRNKTELDWYYSDQKSELMTAIIANEHRIDRAVSQTCHQLISLCRWISFHLHHFSQQFQTIIKSISQSWTFTAIFGVERQGLISLILLWAGGTISSSEDEIIDESIEDKWLKMFRTWLAVIKSYSIKQIASKAFNKQNMAKIQAEAFLMVRLTNLTIPIKRDVFGLIKQEIFSMCNACAQIQPLLFASMFSLLISLAGICGIRPHDFLNIEDLVKHEKLFYWNCWQLTSRDLIHHFPGLKQFMRDYSQYSLLEVNFKICPTSFALLEETNEAIQMSISAKQAQSLQSFYKFPVRMSKIVLEHCLKLSGIALPVKLPTQRNISRGKKPPTYDPLHFLLIRRQIWQDPFYRNILELAFWISLDSYNKWLIKNLPRNSQVKEVDIQEHIKKMNLAACIFLLTLSHPTRMLQYFPVEMDTFRDLFIQPIFPTLILNNKFFFGSYNWRSAVTFDELQNDPENWILPWAQLLTSTKHMQLFLSQQDGYRLAYALITKKKLTLDKKGGDFLISRIAVELQKLDAYKGESTERRLLEEIPAQRRLYMRLLLEESEKAIEKATATAQRLIRLLSQ